jgi:tripartite-type tricarboxylate transporter receptor subunit TctC
VVVVPAASPIRTLADLIAQAQARPGAMDYGTPGVGSPAHLFTELLAQTAGVRLQHVPYGRMPAINDLLGGTLHLMVATIPVALPHVQGGRLRALAVTGRQRFGALPQVPTVAEAGLPGFEAGQFLAVFAPGATPAGTIRRLADEIGRTVAAPETGAQFAARGLVPLVGGPAELAQRLSAETRTWARVMKDGDIRLDA